jgi:hypothetical protein
VKNRNDYLDLSELNLFHKLEGTKQVRENGTAYQRMSGDGYRKLNKGQVMKGINGFSRKSQGNLRNEGSYRTLGAVHRKVQVP